MTWLSKRLRGEHKNALAAAVPAVAFYYFFRNKATKIILNMEGLTLDLIKVLRNVEVVSE